MNRYQLAETYTLGRMYVEGMSGYIPTIEDVVRPDGEKVWGETAIPAGRYKVVMDVVSPKFSQYKFYMDVCEGKLPRLEDVPEFDAILLHCGRTEKQSSGCIILNDYNAPLDRSKEYFKLFYDAISKAEDEIWLTIA